MAWILNFVYGMILVASSPWLVWRAWRRGKNRRGWSAKLFGFIDRPAERKSRIWFHAVSVGEVNLLDPILRKMHEQFPGWDHVISTTTETGYDLACKKYPQCQVFFCPIDFTWAVRRVLHRLQPKLIVLAELELWPNLLQLAEQRGIPVAVVNGRLSERSARGYQRFGWIARRMFGCLSMVAAQTETYAERFRKLGVPADRIQITGNVKFDNASPERHRETSRSLTALFGISESETVLVGGSTQFEEDQMLVEAFERLRIEFPSLRLVLVPRHPQRVPELKQFLRSKNLHANFRSEFLDDNHRIASPTSRIIVVDVIGELGAWWCRADLAYVGGSMGSRGGQNMIEPAACGVPTSFGPRTENFRDIVELLLRSEAAVVVRDQPEFESFARRAMIDRTWAKQIGDRAQQLAINQQGASQQTVALLSTLVTQSSRPIQLPSRAA